jgi:hypothetical protein
MSGLDDQLTGCTIGTHYLLQLHGTNMKPRKKEKLRDMKKRNN